MKAVGTQYLDALERGNLKQILGLFAPEAVVKSPVYGRQTPQSFFESLLADTRESRLELHQIFQDEPTRCLALYFTYHWTLKNGSQLNFEVVDILRLNAADQIISLSIIYDSAEGRKNVNKLHAER